MGTESRAFSELGIPLLGVWHGDPYEAARRGTVLFVHGLHAQKEGNRKELDQLADRGFLAIGLDALGHGERRWHEVDLRKMQREIIPGTVREIPLLVGRLRELGLVFEDRVGLCGVSMGGFIGYGVATSGCLRALVAFIASPDWGESEESPMKRLDSFFPCAVLSLVAGRDENVDPTGAPRFTEAVRSRYERAPDRLECVVYPQSGHFMREEDWHDAMGRTLGWFERFFR